MVSKEEENILFYFTFRSSLPAAGDSALDSRDPSI